MRIPHLALAAALLTSPAMANDVFGLWKSEPSDTGAYIHVEIAPCANDAALVCGKIIETFKGDPNRAPIVGRMIIENMAADGANQWDSGTIWAPDDDKTYSSEMELNGNVLEVSGCVLGGLICRGQDWTRVQ